MCLAEEECSAVATVQLVYCVVCSVLLGELSVGSFLTSHNR